MEVDAATLALTLLVVVVEPLPRAPWRRVYKGERARALSPKTRTDRESVDCVNSVLSVFFNNDMCAPIRLILLAGRLRN